MILFKLAVTLFLTLFTPYIESFTNTVTVFKRWNSILKRHNYLITTGDIHEGLPQLNNDQISAIKSLIYNSDPRHTLFLVEDIANIKTAHPLLDGVVDAINSTYSNPTMKTRIPLVTLVDYALTHKKNAENLDDRAHTLIQTIFYYLIMSYIQKLKVSSKAQQVLIADYKISLPEIGSVLTQFLKNLENDYATVCEKLRTLQSKNSYLAPNQREQNQLKQKNFELEDLSHYLKFYNSFSSFIENDKEYATSLINKNFDLITYFVKEYKNYKNIKSLDLESSVEGFNFNIYVGSTFLTRMLAFGSYKVELKALKFIIENLNSKSKIVIFTGQKHTENLNTILEQMSFKKIYHKIQTQNVSKIYAQIADHVQQAKSFNKINSNYILKMKQNLKPIDPKFYTICQKKHLYTEDFKGLN